MTPTVTRSARRPALRTARTPSMWRAPGRQDLRIEFSGWDRGGLPAGLRQRRRPCRPARSARTTPRSSSSQLGTGDADHVDLGLIIPDQVIQANAPISTAIEYAGDPPTRPTPSPRATPSWLSRGRTSAPPKTRAGRSAGSRWRASSRWAPIWGTSYIRNGNRMLASPTVKRMSGLGPGGLGAIYQINDVLNPDGSLNTVHARPRGLVQRRGPQRRRRRPARSTSATSRPTERAAVDWATTTPRPRISPRFRRRADRHRRDGHLARRPSHVRHEPAATRSIYGINIDDPDITPTAAMPFDTPVGPGQQLWAVTTYRNRLYLGYVDTGTRPGSPPRPPG